jgi:1,4-alpha-glucan branching enzyme
LNWIGLEFAEYRRALDETPLRPWDPLKEPLRDFRKRIHDHIEERKAVARKERWVPQGKETDFQEYHFRWLALSQVAQKGAKDIRTLCDSRPELVPPDVSPRRDKGVSRRTIQDAVKVIGKALGLPRRGPGRQPSRNNRGSS